MVARVNGQAHEDGTETYTLSCRILNCKCADLTTVIYNRLVPFAQPFMALFGREQLPHRATLSRFLAAVDTPCLQALRQLFQDDLLQNGFAGEQLGGFLDCQGHRLLVFDVDATRQAARQRALASSPDLPPAQRRMQAVCAPGYTGRKRGEVVRTRTTVLQAHTQEWLGTFSNPGNGEYAVELEAACRVITAYLVTRNVQSSDALVRLDGLYGTIALLARLQSFKLGFLCRGRDYQLLDHPTIQARLLQPCDLSVTHIESQVQRELFDAGFIADWLPEQPEVVIYYRVVVARRTAPADPAQISVGKLRGEHVYELFLTSHSASRLPAATVLELYGHRGSFEQVLSDEDDEQDPDRWCSRTECGQEFWQILSQWVWNIRLRMGQAAQPQPLRWTRWESAALMSPAAEPDRAVPSGALLEPAVAVVEHRQPAPTPAQTADLVPIYGPLELSQPWAKARRRFSAQDFRFGEGDTLICPTGKILRPRERRRLPNGDLRVLYAAKVHECRTCPQAGACLGRGASGEDGRRVSGMRRVIGWQMQPSLISDQPGQRLVKLQQEGQEVRVLEWCDLGGRGVRRGLVRQLRRQQVSITSLGAASAAVPEEARVWTRAERARRRRSWADQLARNACGKATQRWSVTLPGVAPALAAYLGLRSLPAP